MSHVILLHGLHMHAWAMKPFAHMLEQEGFSVATFGYYSLWQTMSQHTELLWNYVRSHYADSEGVLHFVGHSLGGLVLRHFAAAHPEAVSGRMVTLGTPHRGSAAAEQVRRLGFALPVLGGAYETALDGRAPPLPDGIELGSLAGNKAQGLGWMMGLDGRNDGTVQVAETRCAGMRDHIVLPVSHSGMLLSKDTVRQTAVFLKRGAFEHG